MERAPAAAAAAASPWFRVSVDLRRYFSDARARIYLLVPGGGGGRRVAWLSRRLRRRLGAALAGPHALSVEGRALPPREPLALLQPGDEIMVTPMETDCFPDSDGEVSDIEDYEILQQKISSNTSNLLENNAINLFHTRKRKHSVLEQLDSLQDCAGTSAESTTMGDYVDGAEQLHRVKLHALSLLEATTVAARPDEGVLESRAQLYFEPGEPLVVESDKLAEPWNGTKNLEHERSASQPRAGRRRRVRRRPRRIDPGSDGATLDLETTEGSEESVTAAAAAAARPGRLVRAL